MQLTLPTFLTSIFVTKLFFLLTIFLVPAFICINKTLRAFFKEHSKSILLLFLVGFILKFPFNSPFFHGREYEDAYIYKVTARFMYANVNYSTIFKDSYLTNYCIFGNIKDCRRFASQEGHVIAYPIMISMLYSIFGYNTHFANYLSLAFSSLGIIILYVLAYHIYESRKYALICCFVYLTIPILNVFSSTSFSELTSHFYIGLLLLVYIVYLYYPSPIEKYKVGYEIINWLTVFSLVGLVILIKRENMMMLLCLPVISVAHLLTNKELSDRTVVKRQLIKIIPIIVVFLIFYLEIMDIVQTVIVEDTEIGAKAFSPEYMKSLFPVFALSLFNWKWYLFFSIFLILGYLSGFKRGYFIYPLVCFTFYFLLYTAHHRSYYFIKEGTVYNFDTIRYMMGIIIFYCLLCGMSLYRLINYVYESALKKNNSGLYFKIVSCVLCLIIIVGSQIYTYRLRSLLCEDEYVGRFVPVRYVLENVDTNDAYIITSKPLLFQIYGPDNLKVFEFGLIGTGIPSNVLDAVIDSNDVYYLVDEGDLVDVNRRRFSVQNKYLESKKLHLVHKGMNYWVYKVQGS